MKILYKYTLDGIFSVKAHLVEEEKDNVTKQNLQDVFKHFKKARNSSIFVNDNTLIYFDKYEEWDNDIVTVREYESWNSYDEHKATFKTIKSKLYKMLEEE